MPSGLICSEALVKLNWSVSFVNVRCYGDIKLPIQPDQLMPFIIHTGKLELGEIAKKKRKKEKQQYFAC